MPVNITIKNCGLPDSAEFNAALSIKEAFTELPVNIDGDLLIMSSVTIPGGYTPKDVDIIIVGKNFVNNHQILKCKCVQRSYGKITELPIQDYDVHFQSFIYSVELKDHDDTRIKVDNDKQVFVEYNGMWSCATGQSQGQKGTLLSYLKSKGKYSSFIRNFVWMRQMSKKKYEDSFDDDEHNVLFGKKFDVADLFAKSVWNDNNGLPFMTSKGDVVVNDLRDDVDRLYEHFTFLRSSCGDVTRHKLELLTQRYLESEDFESVGNKLTVLKGLAGTGKTVRLLQIAYRKAFDEGERCLILTYNHALTSDIKRLIDFSGMPDAPDGKTVQIQTLHKFFLDIMRKNHVLGLDESLDELNFTSEYLQKIHELEGLSVMSAPAQWDYVLIDEAQDWSDSEKNILFRLYPKDRIVVADGVNQFMRSTLHQNWIRGIPEHNFFRKEYNVGLRQKNNLVAFVNAFALEGGLRWFVDGKFAINGGKVIVKKGYNFPYHMEQLEYCKEMGNASYDILFLIPKDLTDRNSGAFIYYEKMKESGIYLFDGANRTNRIDSHYSTDVNECRLYQYHSCRGLEGWTVICMAFDVLYDEVFMEYINQGFQPAIARLKTIQWVLMPLTRAIDRLIILINKPESEAAKLLYHVYMNRPDVVTWLLK